MPALLDAAEPDVILLELPEELQPWLSWLGSQDLRAPVAMAAARADGRGLMFAPYADFSPELAVVRWAATRSVPVHAFDLPVRMSSDEKPEERVRFEPDQTTALIDVLQQQLGVENGEELWDRLVEAFAPDQQAEAVRRAALLTGWALRLSAEASGHVPERDLRREAWMRRRLREATKSGFVRPVAVVGSFHAPALLRDEPDPQWGEDTSVEVVTSLIPYAFELLDSRSGYPAGIRDPEWQQAVWGSGCSAAGISASCSDFAVRITRELRSAGHAAGVPDSREVVRVADDLARLRSLPCPGRRELVEALQVCLAQGEPLGRGRAVARAMEVVLVGRRRGQLADGTPRSGLVPHVEALLAELGLPGPQSTTPIDVRWDPLRSELDKRRHIAVQRLNACGVPYATPIGASTENAATLTVTWRLSWGPATAALLELAGHRGVTLEQAAEGSLRKRLADGDTPSSMLLVLSAAAAAGLPRLTEELLDALPDQFVSRAALPELIGAVDLVERLLRGHVAGYQPAEERAATLEHEVVPALMSAAVHQLEGLMGSERIEDAYALLAFGQHARDDAPEAIGDTRIKWALGRLANEGSPLMQGAGGAVRVLLGHEEAAAFSERVGSWIDMASDGPSVRALSQRLRGTLAVAAPLMESSSEVTSGLVARIASLTDDGFLRRLPALRDGFEVMSPAARQRFLDALQSGIGERIDFRLEHAPQDLALWAAADIEGRRAIEAIDREVLQWAKTS